MKAQSFQCRGWIFCPVSVCCLILAHFGHDERARVGHNERKRAPNKEAKMINDIANRNQPPKIVKGDSVDIPLFPKNYDWKEQNRVLNALDKLEDNLGLKLWEELVQKVDDNRYSLTVANKATNAPYNSSVGDFCYELAHWRLVDVFTRYLPIDPSPVKNGRQIRLDIVPRRSIKEWRRERKKKPFYELQIEVCEMAIVELQKSERVSQEEKNEARKKIEAEIEKLKKTKQPVIIKSRTSAFDSTYGPNDAKRFHKQLGLDE